MRTYLLFTTNRPAINLSSNLMTLRFFSFLCLLGAFMKTALSSGGHLTDCPSDDVQMVCGSAGNRLSLVGRASRNKCKIPRTSNGIGTRPCFSSFPGLGGNRVQILCYGTSYYYFRHLHTITLHTFDSLQWKKKTRWLFLCLVDTNSVESNYWFWLKWGFLNCVVVLNREYCSVQNKNAEINNGYHHYYYEKLSTSFWGVQKLFHFC